MWTLVVDSGKHRGRQVQLKADTIVVGRSDDAQIRISSGEVSREHCTLLPTAHGVLVKDHGSRNGTLINDERITSQVLLAPGSTLTVGPMRFRLAKVVRTATRFSLPVEGMQKLSDDDIASWLTDDQIPLASDTTVIGGEAAATTGSESPAAAPAPKRWVPPASRAKFDSIAEEAADIIRRHREMLIAEAGPAETA
ncbi:MAG: FHA domain-containing protein [Planctomycetaceae bacterium]|nr:FHA domain-containing protein [Planctomycetaceae bacterium]